MSTETDLSTVTNQALITYLVQILENDPEAEAILRAFAPYLQRKLMEKMAPTEKVNGIFVSSKAIHAEKWRGFRERGAPIISTWIDNDIHVELDKEAMSVEWQRAIAQASTARVLIFYRTLYEQQRGSWIQLGAALASGALVFAVGINEYSIATDPRVTTFATIEDAFAAALAIVNPPLVKPGE